MAIDLSTIQLTPDAVENSRKWFDTQIRTFRNSLGLKNPNYVLKAQQFRVGKRMLPGRMYFFFYDPKTKETLPYYDTFPLVLPYAKTEEGFIGLNLHYLEYRPRMFLLNELARISGANFLNDNDKLRFSWETVVRMSKLRYGRPCIKQYLNTHVRSPFAEVPSQYWQTAVMLPVQQFVGASNRQVWRQSGKAYGGF